jgi:hypothetical protein
MELGDDEVKEENRKKRQNNLSPKRLSSAKLLVVQEITEAGNVSFNSVA